MTRKTTRPRRLGILPGLALLFVIGAVLRLATGFDAALARDPVAGSAPAVPAVPAVAASPSGPQAHPIAAQAPAPDDAAGLLLDLRRRETQLAERAVQVEQRLAVMEATEARIRDQITALRAAETELEATMALADRAAEDDITRLVGVFEAMEPEQAAAVFAEMEPSFAAGFLGRLAPQTAAEILAGLEPRHAYALSALLAGRNALVPRD